MAIVMMPTSGFLRDALNPLVGLSPAQKSSIDFDVEGFENSGNANVLDPGAQARIQARLMDVPGAARWKESMPNPGDGSGRGYDSWENLWNRVRYRIQDAAGLQTAGKPPATSGLLAMLDSLLGRAGTNSLIGYAPPPPGSPPGTLSIGENAADPANRGVVDKIGDKFDAAADKLGDWLPWIGLGLGALAVIVIIVAVRK